MKIKKHMGEKELKKVMQKRGLEEDDFRHHAF